MEVRFAELTRGSGKIYCHLALEGAPEGAAVEVASHTESGDQLPATCVSVPGVPGPVCVLPVLDVTQNVSVRVLDVSGAAIAHAEKSLSARSSRLRSQINTATRNDVAARIRNCDAPAPREGACGITIAHTDEIVCGGGEDVLRGEVRVLSWDRAEAGADIEVRVLGAHGSPVNVGDVIVMGDTLRADAERAGLLVRTVSFSVRIPTRDCQVVLWAQSAAASLGDAFVCVESFRMRERREDFWRRTCSADRDGEYERWFLDHLRATELDLEAQRRASWGEGAPLFSLIVPLYRTPIAYLREMADSVLAQTYPNLELLLVNASPEDAALAAEVAAYAGRDGRVRVVELDENRGITLNTNEGIKAARGDFLCFLDHDDVIEPDLLYHYARAVEGHPDTDLLYCDEDKLMDGHFCQAFFKPDWSPDLLCSCNYVCHLLCVRASVVAQMELPGAEFDGAQDHHMTLRVGEVARNVYHVRRVLYHWRVHPQSTAANPDSKSYTSVAGTLAVQRHLERTHVEATARMDERTPNTYHVDYTFSEHPLVSIVIPNKDMADVLDRCLSSIAEKSTYPNYEVVVVENNSEQEATFAYYEKAQRQWPNVRVVVEPTADGTFNFARTVNYGFSQAKGEFLLMLNNDTEVITPDWLERLAGPCRREDIGLVGAKLLYPDGLIQHAGVFFHFDAPGHFGKTLPSDTQDYFNLCNLAQDLTAVTGACLMCSRAVWDELGGLDETFAVEYNDIDFCLRAQQHGRRVLYNPDVVLYHHESISRGQASRGPAAHRSCAENGRMMQLYPRYFVDGDPYLNPNLVRHNEHRCLKKYVD